MVFSPLLFSPRKIDANWSVMFFGWCLFVVLGRIPTKNTDWRCVCVCYVYKSVIWGYRVYRNVSLKKIYIYCLIYTDTNLWIIHGIVCIYMFFLNIQKFQLPGFLEVPVPTWGLWASNATSDVAARCSKGDTRCTSPPLIGDPFISWVKRVRFGDVWRLVFFSKSGVTYHGCLVFRHLFSWFIIKP